MSKLYIFAPDLHFPIVHWPTYDAMLDFVAKNKIDGFVFGGDQFDNQEVSPHTRGKHLLREGKRLAQHTKDFDTKILKPLEKLLEKSEKIYIHGNHDAWLEQFIEEHPELQGSLERESLLRLEERGWKVIPCGKVFKKGKLTFAHGEQLTGIGNQVSGQPAKKAVDAYCGSVLFGHFHSLQVFGKVMPYDGSQKWAGYCSPCLCNTNPAYLRNRPTSFISGFTIVEFHGDSFNVYPIVVTKGRFAFGGKEYGSKK